MQLLLSEAVALKKIIWSCKFLKQQQLSTLSNWSQIIFFFFLLSLRLMHVLRIFHNTRLCFFLTLDSTRHILLMGSSVLFVTHCATHQFGVEILYFGGDRQELMTSVTWMISQDFVTHLQLSFETFLNLVYI
jgi:hypothetical protein